MRGGLNMRTLNTKDYFLIPIFIILSPILIVLYPIYIVIKCILSIFVLIYCDVFDIQTPLWVDNLRFF